MEITGKGSSGWTETGRVRGELENDRSSNAAGEHWSSTVGD